MKNKWEVVNYNYQDKTKNIQHSVSYMLNRSLAMFRYINLPDTIPQIELEKLLQCNGFACIAKYKGDLYAVNGGLGGEPDVYNRPTECIVAVPALNWNETLEIDSDCVIMKNDTMMEGLLPIYQKYCYMLSENDISMILATVNKRVQILLSANDDNTATSAKLFLKDVEAGKQGVVAEQRMFDSLKVNNATNASSNTLKELYESRQYIKSELYNEIGLNANNNMKREKVVTAEVEINSENLYPLIDNMINERRIALQKINDLFGTDIQVEFSSSWDYRSYNGESIDTLNGESEIDSDGISEIDTLNVPETLEDEGSFNNGSEKENEGTFLNGSADGGTESESSGTDAGTDPERESGEPEDRTGTVSEMEDESRKV